jgi:3-hydroxyisobutyrate dehydrogenase-like beta-hydroxyacid dehydrogenase
LLPDLKHLSTKRIFLGYWRKKKEVWEMDSIVQHSPEADVLIIKVREGALVNEVLLDNDGILGYD